MNSLIVPVYNARKTIKRLIDSVPKDWELILVEDGSSEPIDVPDIDGIYIKQDNQGPGAARNKGLKYATGDYVFFADADDEIINRDWEPYLKHDMVYSYFLEVGERYESGRYTKTCGCVYGVAYKRQFLVDNEIWFPPLLQMEDIAFNTICQNMSNDWAELQGYTYKYIVTPGSITQTRDFNKTSMPYHVKSDVYVFNYFKDRDIDLAYKLTAKNLSYYYYSLMAIQPRMTETEIEAFYRELGIWQEETRTLDNMAWFDAYKDINKKAAIDRLGEFKEHITINEFFDKIRSNT